MTNKTKKINKLTCESCGKTFECGAETGTCWCFFIEISPTNLSELEKQFKNCLCQECLPKTFQPENQITQGN